MVISLRPNTFKVDLQEFEKRPTFEDVHNLIFKTTPLRPQQVQRLQISHSQCCVYVTCNKLETALEVVEQHNNRHELEVAGKRYKVRLLMDVDRIEVKVHDLSENVTNAEIATFLQQYGEVFSIKEAVWGKSFAGRGIPTGVRIVEMTLREHLKSYVTIKSEQTYISYLTQPATCRHSSQLVHTGKSCAANKKSLARNPQNADVNVNPSQVAAPVGAHLTPSPLTTKIRKKNDNDTHKQQQKKAPQQQQSKRTSSQAVERTSSVEKSPPRKRMDSKQTTDGTTVSNEFSTDDDDMQTSEEEPSYEEDSDKWLVWIQKKHSRDMKRKMKKNTL